MKATAYAPSEGVVQAARPLFLVFSNGTERSTSKSFLIVNLPLYRPSSAVVPILNRQFILIVGAATIDLFTSDF